MIVISVIVPVYKVEKYLERCITSILNQTFNDFELILIDDGSPDLCGRICDKWAQLDNRIKVIHKNNGGLSSARNAGLDIASAEYVIFVDSDDWIPEDALEYLYTFITRTNADFVIAGNKREVKYQSEYQSCFTESVINQKDFLTKFFKIKSQENVQYAWAKLYRRVLFEDIRYPLGVIDEDVPVTFEIALKAKKIGYSTKIVYYYFINPESITEEKFSYRKFDLLTVWDLVCKKADETKDDWIIKNAYLNRNRADFGVLCNYALASNRKEINAECLLKINDSLHSLKKNYYELIKSSIPFSRKVMILMFCFSFKISIILIDLIKRMK